MNAGGDVGVVVAWVCVRIVFLEWRVMTWSVWTIFIIIFGYLMCVFLCLGVECACYEIDLV